MHLKIVITLESFVDYSLRLLCRFFLVLDLKKAKIGWNLFSEQHSIFLIIILYKFKDTYLFFFKFVQHNCTT